MNSLAEEIILAINQSGGALTFHRFMEMALYHPSLGYYERVGRGPGKKGDFFTSVSVGSLFGRLLAVQFSQWLNNKDLASIKELHIVEAGSHDGQLAGDILKCLEECYPDLLNKIHYWILEPSAQRRSWQQNRFSSTGLPVSWAASFDNLPAPLTGILFSNELLDSFPVCRLGWDKASQSWFEWGVTVRQNDFDWCKLPLTSPVAKPDLPLELLQVLPDQFTVDVSPTASDWWRSAARKLTRGWLLTCDYGLHESDMYHPSRCRGTLRAYRGHQMRANVLANPGDQDLTSHINWTQLKAVGQSAGLETELFQTQSEFLIGIARTLDQHPASGFSWNPALIRQFQTLTHPEHLGHKFQVLIQKKCPATPVRPATIDRRMTCS